ncbi:MAG: hypothetical protein K1Y36_01245 [Blastocatellia bacterium]|nr:hypothetical protein [Blastocatellia bacterium]
MSPALRKSLLAVTVVFAGIGVWQYFGYQGTKDETTHFWISVVFLVISMGALLTFFLTKPEEDPSDISITKF